jgi:ribosomal-protein-alanine N-acetyltransferase
MQIRLSEASADYQAEFIAAVRRSRKLHRPWVSPPRTAADFRRYLATRQGPNGFSYFVLSEAGALAGVINLTEIVRGHFQSGYLGYYAFSPHERHGYMRRGLAKVVDLAFRSHRLHRVEANIQPQNRASLALVERVGFRKEGYSPRYLKIAGRWRDHERWAITREDWTARGRAPEGGGG